MGIYAAKLYAVLNLVFPKSIDDEGYDVIAVHLETVQGLWHSNRRILHTGIYSLDGFNGW